MKRLIGKCFILKVKGFIAVGLVVSLIASLILFGAVSTMAREPHGEDIVDKTILFQARVKQLEDNWDSNKIIRMPEDIVKGRTKVVELNEHDEESINSNDSINIIPTLDIGCGISLGISCWHSWCPTTCTHSECATYCPTQCPSACPSQCNSICVTNCYTPSCSINPSACITACGTPDACPMKVKP